MQIDFEIYKQLKVLNDCLIYDAHDNDEVHQPFLELDDDEIEVEFEKLELLDILGVALDEPDEQHDCVRDEVDDEVEANVIILDYNEAIDEMLMIHAEVIDETEVLQVEVVIVDEADDDDELDIVIDEMVEVECNDEADEIDEIELLDVDDIDENDDK